MCKTYNVIIRNKLKYKRKYIKIIIIYKVAIIKLNEFCLYSQFIDRL